MVDRITAVNGFVGAEIPDELLPLLVLTVVCRVRDEVVMDVEYWVANPQHG